MAPNMSQILTKSQINYGNQSKMQPKMNKTAHFRCLNRLKRYLNLRNHIFCISFLIWLFWQKPQVLSGNESRSFSQEGSKEQEEQCYRSQKTKLVDQPKIHFYGNFFRNCIFNPHLNHFRLQIENWSFWKTISAMASKFRGIVLRNAIQLISGPKPEIIMSWGPEVSTRLSTSLINVDSLKFQTHNIHITKVKAACKEF